MSYTIVYDRRFLKCGDRYIPFALFGDNNVTEHSFKTGREVRCRSWGTFIYRDEMLLGTAEEILAVVNQYHPKNSQKGEGFVFRGKWMNDASVYRFYENGIREAMTIEDIAWQTHENCICGEIKVYRGDFTYDNDLSSKWSYLHTSDEIRKWVEEAKEIKADLLTSGKAKYVYICLGLFNADPLAVTAIKERNVPYVAVCRERHGAGRTFKSYVQEVDSSRMSYTQDYTKALVFKNIEEAYLSIPRWGRDTIKLVPAASAATREEKTPSKYVLTALINGTRVYIKGRVRGHTYYTSAVSQGTKRFRTEKAALKWFDEMLSGRTKFSEPKAEFIA